MNGFPARRQHPVKRFLSALSPFGFGYTMVWSIVMKGTTEMVSVGLLGFFFATGLWLRWTNPEWIHS